MSHPAPSDLILCEKVDKFAHEEEIRERERLKRLGEIIIRCGREDNCWEQFLYVGGENMVLKFWILFQLFVILFFFF